MTAGFSDEQKTGAKGQKYPRSDKYGGSAGPKIYVFRKLSKQISSDF